MPTTPANVPLLCVEIGTACLRASFLLHGTVKPAYEREAAHAMVAYLGAHLVRYGSEGRKLKNEELQTLYRGFLREVDRLVNAIDQLRVP